VDHRREDIQAVLDDPAQIRASATCRAPYLAPQLSDPTPYTVRRGEFSPGFPERATRRNLEYALLAGLRLTGRTAGYTSTVQDA